MRFLPSKAKAEILSVFTTYIVQGENGGDIFYVEGNTRTRTHPVGRGNAEEWMP